MRARVVFIAAGLVMLGSMAVPLPHSAWGQELPNGAAAILAGSGDKPLDTIHKQVDEVNLTFTVADRHGRFVTGLEQDDIRLLDDGHPPVSVHAFQSQTDVPLHICIVIDTSDSIIHRMRFQQDTALAFLSRLLRPGVDAACVVKFAHQPDLLQSFTDDMELLRAGIVHLKPAGDTAVWDAVRFTSELLRRAEERGPVRRVMVLITDGDDNASRSTHAEAIREVLQSGTQVEVVRSRDIDWAINNSGAKLHKLALATGGRVWSGQNGQAMGKAMLQLEETLRSQYFVAYRPAGKLIPGTFRKIRLRTERRLGRIFCRSGYYVE